MLKWVNLVLKPYVAQNAGISHVLIDDYSSHKVSSVVKAIRSLGCLVTVLPGGSTSKIQPMDVGVNKPFKDHLKKSWVLRMMSVNAENDISRQTLSHWIAESFNGISEDSIKTTFQKCGFY
jgi:hypothetical protein